MVSVDGDRGIFKFAVGVSHRCTPKAEDRRALNCTLTEARLHPAEQAGPDGLSQEPGRRLPTQAIFARLIEASGSPAVDPEKGLRF